MKSLTFAGKDQIEWRDAPDSKLQGDGEAIVRPLAVATCDLDQLIVRGMIPFEEPFPIGHECVAEVLAVRDAVQNSAPGDRVVVPFQIS
ncbi:alcohol dehydrogenase catalytic domain-containing protein, partial [Bradyrhizobium sp. NBAIM08]|uniref:alcohol dehydrogenase catalytic domain-containing protein n=1 Tax=Bradyrhizobium sp. NBAIM08 TaxID=2793815 RepID=UPI001CD62380